MDLRNIPDGLSPVERCEERRKRVEGEWGTPLNALRADPQKLGSAEERNCEQMIGHVPIPIGIAGPLRVVFSSGESCDIVLPLATTEAALVASVNRGCKALTLSDGVRTSSQRIGITRSVCFRISGSNTQATLQKTLEERSAEWRNIGEKTSDHLRITSFDIDAAEDHLFLTLYGDTDKAMGMNMITIAAQAIGDWIVREIAGMELITVAGNVDSDKKPSKRTHDRGRGFTVRAETLLSPAIIADVLKTTPQKLINVAHAKLTLGSKIAGAIGANLHAANIVAALYLATGQDAAHVVEGSLADTNVEKNGDGIAVSVRLPAVLVGVQGGGTALPAQQQCLNLLCGPKGKLHPSAKLAETVGAAVLAGEISLLAAQASQSLASSHKKLAR